MCLLCYEHEKNTEGCILNYTLRMCTMVYRIERPMITGKGGEAE